MPAVHRHDDLRTCNAKTIVKGQSNVYVNNKLASVQGDECTHIGGSLSATVNPGTVFINNKLVVCQGSDASPDRRGHIKPKSANGSPDVFIG